MFRTQKNNRKNSKIKSQKIDAKATFREISQLT